MTACPQRPARKSAERRLRPRDGWSVTARRRRAIRGGVSATAVFVNGGGVSADPGVGDDVGARAERGEEGVLVLARRAALEQLHGARAAAAVLLEALVVQEEVKDVPVARVVADAANLFFGCAGTSNASLGTEE